MHKTKLISILGTFSEKEMSLFEKWMKSDFFNTNKNQANLLKYLVACYPDFESRQVEKEKVFSFIFPSEIFNDARMRNLISDLQEKAENFLTWSAFFENKSLQQQLLIKELNGRKLHSLFESRLKEARKEIEDSKMNSFSSTLNHFLLDEEEFLHYFTMNYGRAYKVSQKYDTEKVIRSATNVYLIHTLYYYHKLLDDQKKYGNETGMFGNFEKLVGELYVETGQDNILALIYLKVIKLLHSENKDYYFEIKKEMKRKEFDSLSDHDQQSVVVILSNFIAREYLNGSEGALREILELGAISLKKKFCFLGPHISHIFFLNYVNFLIADKKTAEAKKFAAEYENAIQTNMKESTFHFAMAYIFLAEKKFPQALTSLKKVANDTPQRGVAIKNLLLKIYFEKNEMDQVPFLIDAIRHNLSSESFLGDHFIAGQKNFLHYYNILNKIKHNDVKTPQKILGKIIGEMKQPGYITNRDWLLGIAEELQKKKI